MGRKERKIVESLYSTTATTIVISIMTSVSMPDLSLSLLGAVAPCDDDDDGSARRAMMTALADAADG